MDHSSSETATTENNTPSISSTSHGLVFSDWSSYQLVLLFESFNIQEPWQFALTFFAVAFAAIVVNALSALQHFLMTAMSTMAKESDDDNKRPHAWIAMKGVVALISGLQYALSLLLMLVAMSFNPSLLLALGVLWCWLFNFLGFLLGF